MRKIELRKISFCAALSEETSAYAAQVWVDGVHIADVQNQGHGGPDMAYPTKGKTRADLEELEAYCKTLPPTVTKWKDPLDPSKPFVVESDLEKVCGDLLSAHLIEKDVKRLIKRTVAFFEPATKAIRSYKGKIPEAQRAALIAQTLAKYPEAKVLNTMPLAEAVKLMREAA